jgi:type II secretory pathway pseudopilin PulG
MALGMMLILLALSLVVLQNFVTDGKRAQEEETIWRGEQYQRAIRLYYHKMGHYPQALQDLQKGGLQLHFLRQAYKNPMNLRQSRRPNYRQRPLCHAATNGAD